jgi:hypothetical protein
MKKLFLFFMVSMYSISISPGDLYNECMKRHNVVQQLQPFSQKALKFVAARNIADSFTLGHLETQFLILEQAREESVESHDSWKQHLFDNSQLLLHEPEVAELICNMRSFVLVWRDSYRSFEDLYSAIQKTASYQRLLNDFPAMKREFHQDELFSRLKTVYEAKKK